MFKLHRHLVDGTIQSAWIRQVFGLDGFHCIYFSVDTTFQSLWLLSPFPWYRVANNRDREATEPTVPSG